MGEDNPQTHSSLVLAALRDESVQSSPEDWVLNSWRRCVDEYDMDPAVRKELAFVDRTDLDERKERNCNLTKIAKLEMTNLFRQISGSGCSILLTDREGVVMNYVGDPLFTNTAANVGLNPGAIWTEAVQGTNGMGTCLVEKRPLVVHRHHHFFFENTGITCAAAPIFDPTGEVAGVLDASSECRLAQQHTMVLVNMSAQLIENRLFLCEMRDRFLLRFHSRPEFVSTLGEGVIAFDAAGQVTAVNRSALFQLGLDHAAEINGRELSEIFSITVEEALGQAQSGGGYLKPLHETRSRRRYYGTFQNPANEQFRTVHTLVPRQRTPRTSALDGLEHGDSRMRRNVARASKLLEKDIPLLILGETGTGKDMFAKAAHQASSRRDRPFVAVNCASIPETLIESELFGYQAGAFTGASKDGSRGKIVQADGGTLFLDEIGDMPLNLQARLLRVLEEREVIPLGGEKAVKVDVRLISATHQDLKSRVVEGSFREDLFYRLHGISLIMPPLREREDRRALIAHLLEAEAGPGGGVTLEDAALDMLDAYDWPGNIRQLRNVLRTLVGLCEEDGVIRVEDLPEEMFANDADDGQDDARPTNPLDIAERDTILREMEAAHWNVTRVASKLDVSRNTLYRKMKRFGIRTPR